MQCIWTDDQAYKSFCSLLRETDLSDEALEHAARQWLAAQKESKQSIDLQRLWVTELKNRVKELDFITPFLADPDISEIMINGTNRLFVERGSERIGYEISISEERLNSLIQKIVASVNRSVNLKEPIVDARLRDGSRVHVVLKPIALNGPIVTIRKFKASLSQLESLEALGCFDKRMTAFLTQLVKEKKSIFVSGSTSSGKTTLLNCLCLAIHPEERVITIEDSAELSIKRLENLVSLETRTLRQNDLTQITMAELIKAALRMRPDRIIVGEIRGAEAHDMLQAMNTGHEGSMSTGHANSAADMLQRIETMALTSGLTSPGAVKQQIASGIDYVVHLERRTDGIRKIREVIQIKGCDNNQLMYDTVYELERGWCI